MKNSDKTKEQLVSELEELRKQSKKREEELKESEKRFSRAISGTDAGLWDWDMVKNTVFFSVQWKKMLGYEDHEIPNDFSGWRKLWHPDEVASTEKAVNDYLEGKSKVYKVENRLLHKDGSWHWILTRGDIERDAAGKPIRWTGTNIDITERKQAEEALKDSEARWQFAVDGSALGLWDWNIQTSEVFFSKQWKAMLGFKEDEISGSLEEWDKRVHPDDKEKVYADINKHLDGNAEFYNNEHRVLCKNNSYKWILDRGKLISRTDDGKPLRMIGTHTDITERKQAEEALRDSERNLLISQQISTTGSWIYDIESNNLNGSAEAKQIFGLSANDDDFTMEKIESCIPERERVHQALIDLLTGGIEYNIEYVINPADNSLQKTISSIARLEKDSLGKPIKVLGFLQDITKRKRAEEDLKESKEHLELSLEGGDLGTWDWNIKTGRVDFSERWAEMKGYKLDDLKPDLSTWEKLVHPDDLKMVYGILNEHLEGKAESYMAEFRMKHKSGKWLWIIDKGKVVTRDEKGNPVRACGTHMDITERKQAEEELKVSRERLKTASSILRHDLTNDLAVIKSAVRIFKRDHKQEMIDEIEKRVEKSIETINNQRDQIQFLDSHSDLDKYDLKEVAQKVVSNYQDLECTIKGNCVTSADNALYSVFDNLVSNAVRHGKTTKLDVEIISNKENCEIRFKDYGIGVPDEIKDKVFDKDFHYGETGHTGIGLFIVRKTIEEYGGEVFVEDNEQQGAVFIIRLKKAIAE